MQNESYGAAWDQVIARLLSEPDGSMVAVDETDVEPPRLSGMTRMPLPSDDGRPVYGAFLDATSAFVVHHVGTTYQVKRHPFSTVAHTVQVEPPALRTPVPPPRQTGRPVQREVHVERVETRHLPSHSPEPVSPLVHALIVAGLTASGAAIGGLCGGTRGAVTGASIGGFVSLASVAISTASSSPETAAVAQNLFAGLASAGAAAVAASSGRVVKMTPVRLPPLLGGWEPEEPPRSSAARRVPKRR